MSVVNGLDMGDINHSKKFVTSFLPALAGEVQKRWSNFLASPMVATGCWPPVSVMADKATHQRNMRQLIGGITINPGGEALLVPVFFGAPICPRGDGQYLKDNVVATIDSFIISEQIVNFTGDGVYEHCGVGEKLNSHYNINATFTWDQVHHAATAETALRNPKKTYSARSEKCIFFLLLKNLPGSPGSSKTPRQLEMVSSL
jgi:hypothetical protein